MCHITKQFKIWAQGRCKSNAKARSCNFLLQIYEKSGNYE